MPRALSGVRGIVRLSVKMPVNRRSLTRRIVKMQTLIDAEQVCAVKYIMR